MSDSVSNVSELIGIFLAEVTEKEIEDELKLANSKNIDATPTMYVNGEEVVGVKPYNQLKEILIKHGAKRK